MGLPPFTAWPTDLRDTLGGLYWVLHGGHEFDGREISPLDEMEICDAAREIRAKGIRAVAVSSVFSPVNPAMERRAGEIIRNEIPDAVVSLSHEIGRMGLLERENAAILNACLADLAQTIVSSFQQALHEMHIAAPFYLSQNDGTLMHAEYAAQFPVATFASGPTNSMRGAAFLSGLKDAMVLDIGGTTSDIGMLVKGFPREASSAVDIGGVRTNFRMPDVLSIGLGGGSLVRPDPIRVGPQSVGYELTRKGLVFGGDVLTTTDISVAAGLADIGDRAAVQHLDAAFVRDTLEQIQVMAETAVDRMKTSAEPIPLILVGGGIILIARKLAGVSEMLRPDHYPVANAIGAAIAQVGGESDKVYALANMPREEALAQAKQDASEKVLAGGAVPQSVTIVDVEEIPLAYLPGNAVRIRAKAVGDLALN